MGHSRKSANAGAAKWVCSHGCDQASFLKRFGRGCDHLEAQIGPVIGHDARRILFTDQLDSFRSDAVEPYEAPEEIDEELELRNKLIGYELIPKLVDVLIDRVLHKKTFREIAEDRGYARPQGARTAYLSAKQYLSRKGYR